MSYTYQHYTIRGLLPLLLCLFLGLSVRSQGVTGPNSVALGSAHTYTYDDGNLWPFFNWEVVGGTVTSSGLQSGTTYYADITWNVLGAGSVTAKRKGIVLGSLGITVAASGGGDCATTTVLSDENYVHSVTPLIAVTDTGTLDNGDKVETVTYYDGLGRAKQAIGIRAGGGCEDILTHMEYDPYGRQAKEYLPYAQVNNGGAYRTNALSATGTFYNTAKYENTANPYSEKAFEDSPLNRVLKQAAPGHDWRMGGGHEIEMDYRVNTAGDQIRRFYVTHSFSSNTYYPTLNMSSGYYNAGDLYRTIARDENHTGSEKDHTTEEFKDPEGRTVLKRTYENEMAHDTYYVYDDYGNLTYVLPPLVNTGDGVSATELSELAYQYVYDHRGRLVEKKLPDKGWEYIVYDKLDRPVLTQDANQRAKSPDEWLFTKYDTFGRTIYTGTYGSNSLRTDLQGTFNGKSEEQNYETKLTTAGTLGIYYSNNDFPDTSIEVLTVNYYDNYTFDRDGGNSETAYTVTPTTDVKGLATGTKVRVLGTNDWTTTVNYYDDKARPIYVYSKNNYLDTTDKIKSQLAFDGTVTEATTSHARTGFGTITTVDSMGYDHMNRLTSHEQTINGGTAEVIVENSYDELGQLESKGVGGTTVQSRLQTVDYRYNIRGWLKAINDVASLGSDLFAFKINYNDQEGAIQYGGLYNGNISQAIWRTANDNVKRGYSYNYDGLNRIRNGIMRTGDNLDVYTRYHLRSISYDKNGNILTLERDGDINIMDDLTYAYDSGNRLLSVTDANTTYTSQGFVDGNTSGNDYSYDANGNMVEDKNKGITAIGYNHLNLPTSVSINGSGGNGTISYIYDATGVKLRKTVSRGTTTNYAGNFVYENSTLKQITHPEGYIEPDGISWQYVYYIKDFWGNTRITFADDNGNGSVNSSEIRKERNFYPFGLEHRGYNNSTYGVVNNLKTYQEQEFTEDLGLNTHEWKYRVSDPAIGRFWQIDPLAEDYVYNSTYAFQENKLGMGIELEGLELFVGSRVDQKSRRVASGERTTMQEVQVGVGLAAAGIGAVSTVVYGAKTVGAVLLNEAKDEVASQLTNGATDYLDASKGIYRLGKEGIQKIGKWIDTNESMSDAAASYQKQITGMDASKSFEVNGVKFDGVTDDGILLDAKSDMSFAVDKNGSFHKWFEGSDGLLDQATRQLKAADGAQIQWKFENKGVMEATQKLFKENDIQGIELIHNPRQ